MTIRKLVMSMLSLCLVLSIMVAPQAKASLNNSNTDWMMNAKYGVFVHYLFPWDAHNFGTNFEAAVNSFDVTNFANQMQTAGAGYVMFTLGQNNGYLDAPNSAYDTYRANGTSDGLDKTASRDLVLDLYNALNAKGIKLMLYTTCDGMIDDAGASAGLGWNGSTNATFRARWGAVLQEWSDRYGSKVAGWWVDGCYNGAGGYYYGWDATNLTDISNFLKHGNANSILAFNPGLEMSKISDSQDFTTGEENDFNYYPSSRWVSGIQAHALTFLGTDWGVDSLKYSNQQVIDYVNAVNSKQGVVTLDMALYANGDVSAQQLNQLAALKANVRGGTADTVYGFDDAASGDAQPFTGTHGGINFGTGQWITHSTDWYALNSKYAVFTGGGSSRTFTLPSGKFLKSIRVGGSAGGTYSISDGVNAAKTGNITNGVATYVPTGWTSGGTTITVNFSGLDSSAIDTIVYGSSSGTPTPSPTPAAIPGKVEAENYSSMSGIQKETTTDTDGGLDVGWIDAGDWMNYNVNVATSGTYTVQYRVASPNSTGQIQIQSNNGPVLATTNVPNTGGWQTWTTVTATVNLTAGNQTISFYASGAGFNVNWLNFTSGSGALNRSGWTAAASSMESGGSVNNTFDGNINTRWSTGTVQVTSPLQWYWINMGSIQSFSKIVIDSGPSSGDYARQYSVFGSNDGSTWTLITTGTGSAVTTITFPTQSYKYFGFHQDGNNSSNWWSIAEVNVYP